MFTLGVTALWTLAKATHGSNLPIVAFALTGYSSVLLWRNMPSRCIGSITPNLALMYHRNVKVIDVFAARVLLEAAGASMSFVVLGLLFFSIGWLNPPEDVLKAYEERINRHDFDLLVDLIAPDAVFWFSDGSHRGLADIRSAFERTWRSLQNETYWLDQLEWLAVGDHAAVQRVPVPPDDAFRAETSRAVHSLSE